LCVARPDTLPLLVAPAMNVEMWQNPATQRNVAQLKADRIAVLGPDTGEQACGETGMGRMLEPEQLLEEIVALFQTESAGWKKRADHCRSDLRNRSIRYAASPIFLPENGLRPCPRRTRSRCRRHVDFGPTALTAAVRRASHQCTNRRTNA